MDTIKNKEFISFWNSRYSNALPLAFTLKDHFEERWLRIHNFSEKRYPTNDSDLTQLLERQNKLLEDFLSEEPSYFLLISSFDDKPGFPSGYEDKTDISKFEQIESLPLHKLAPDDYGPEDSYLRLAISELKWKNHSLDKVLIAISKDEISNVLLIGKEKDCLICPYAGGVDIFVENETIKNIYTQKYVHWIPSADEKSF